MADPLESSRHQQRLAALPAVYKTQPERLAVELALKLDDPTAIFARHGYDAHQALALLQSPDFAALLERVAKEVQEQGLSFRAKARVMAEDLLQHGYELATDELASAAVRADLIQWFSRIADLEPAPKEKAGGPGTGGGLSLHITFSGQEKQAVITGREPVTIEG